MKTLDEIWQIYLDRDLNPEELKDLVWHIDNDCPPYEAITLATDMGLKQLGSVLAKHLSSDDEYTRELTVGCLLGRLELPEYAEKGFEMAQNEDEGSARTLAIFNLGEIMDRVLFSLAQKIAKYLLWVFKNDESKVVRDSSYFSILTAMKIPYEQQPIVSRGVKESDIDSSILSEFCKKYQVTLPEKNGFHLPREEKVLNPHPTQNQRFH